MSKLIITPGPPVTEMSKEAAVAALVDHPHFPKHAADSLSVQEIDGRWVAAYDESEPITKEAAPPFTPAAPSGGASDDTGAPPTDGPPADDGAGADDTDGEDKPSEGDGEGKEHGEKGVEAQIHALTEMVHTLMTALGLDVGGPDGSMMPGAEGMPHAPGPSTPDAADLGGPANGPSDPEGAGGSPRGGKKERVVHERALKPGEAQPGSTPIGAPAFASVREDHPWREVIGKVRSFTAVEEIDEDTTMADVAAELRELADGTGYRVDQLREAREEGRRVAKALLVR
jgi:hypothetical protein